MGEAELDPTLQFPSTRSEHARQILKVVTGSDTKFPHKVFGCAFKVTIISIVTSILSLFFRSAKISIT